MPQTEKENILVRAYNFLVTPSNRLSNSKGKVYLKGARDDVAKLSHLDRKIGKLLRSFNGHTRVDDKIADAIDAAVEKHSSVFNRVSAYVPYEENTVEFLFGKTREGLDKEVAVNKIEYVHQYRSASGNPIEQRLALVYLR